MDDPFPDSNPKRSSTYPPPLILPPTTAHRQTFIILHGRGSNASEFGPSLLKTSTSLTQTFRTTFPHAKFVFPTASPRRAAAFNRSLLTQWFDNTSLHTPDSRTELQIEGLRETSTYIHRLLAQEISLIGAQNIILGGLSQGCAATLITLLTWDSEPLRAAFGMCGWLPFRKQMDDIAQSIALSTKTNINNPIPNPHTDDLFGNTSTNPNLNPAAEALLLLREILDMPASQPTLSFQNTPLILAHGDMDPKVPIELGEDAVNCLEGMGMRVTWREYKGLGHWYSTEMLADLVGFIQEFSGWEEGRECA